MSECDEIATFGIQSPDDRLDHTIRAGLAEGETLPSLAASAEPGGLTIETPIVAGNEITLWISAGAANTGYTIGLTGLTSFGRTLATRISIFIGPVGLDDPSIVAPLN